MTSTIKVNTITTESGSTLTLGGCGKTVALASGASQTGFGRTGAVDWQTSIKTANFTAVSGEGYFCDTASVGAFTLTLPSSPSVGDIVALKDYASNFSTANLTIGRGGSNLNGTAADSIRNTDNESLTLVYADATKGWLSVEEGTGFIGEAFIEATGGTETTVCTNFKVHTFTGPGTFCVSRIATCAANNEVSYMVVAGGGGGGGRRSAGGGAGGFRETKSPVTPYTASPLDGQPSAPNRITVTQTAFPITVGAGGNAGTGNPSVSPGVTNGTNGSNSTFSTITSTGGGAGMSDNTCAAASGGSGGGGVNNPGSGTTPGGSGNTPPTTPSQGNDGGIGVAAPKYGAGGGGGATAVGVGGNTSGDGGNGGAGATTSINGTPTAYAGGGGGGAYNVPAGFMGCGGAGGGGNAGGPGESGGTAGTTNTGGGGGGAYHPGPSTEETGGNGGSGIVIIRYKFQ
jgi:hypothetical protein